MKLLVDADSCPRDARCLAHRTAKRRGLRAVFAANRPIPGLAADEMELCPPGPNAADDRLVELAEPGDLAVCRDIPLAKRLLEKGVSVIDDRGRVFNRENIGELLSLRDFMVGLADNGMETERIAHYGKRELKSFADSLDRMLTRLLKA